jgi:hypothetical protein
MLTETSPATPSPTASNRSFGRRVFFGHHKCATGWITKILMEVCFRLGLTLEITHREVEFADYPSLGAYADDQDADVLIYTNAKIEHVRDLSFQRGFHVIRDPRDVLVSAYFSHLHSHPTDHWPELEEHRHRLESLSKEDGLLAEMEFSAEEFEDMYRWDYAREDVLEWKLEELSPKPFQGFVEVMDFLDMLDRSRTDGLGRTVKAAGLTVNRLLYKGRHVLPAEDDAPTVQTWPSIPTETLRSILDAKSYENLSGGREKGEEDVTSHYRKGVPGDWVNHFSPELKAAFKRRFGGLLQKTGYEPDDSW